MTLHMAAIPQNEQALHRFISIICSPLSIVQYVLTKRDALTYKPPGEMVPVQDACLHAHVMGKGDHTVILEAGMGGSSLDWSMVQPELSLYAKVVSYDRAGLGWSGSGSQPESATCRKYVRELRELLKAMDCKPPYILVGHSYGGMIVRCFAGEYPDEVEGLLLVDAVHESRYLTDEMSNRRKQQREANRRQYKLGYLLAPAGIPRLLRRPVGGRRLPSAIQKNASSLGYRKSAYRAAYAELLCAEESALQLKAAKPLSSKLPITVLSAGSPDEEWKQGQQRLARLTPNVQHITEEDPRHSIPIHRPETVVKYVTELLNTL
ncbi:alpha/beta hydrolase [Paenibacillus phytohabitans]